MATGELSEQSSLFQAGEMRRDETIQALRQLAPVLAARGVWHLYLFGSVARDHAGEASDVDLAFDAAPDIAFDAFDMGGVVMGLMDALGRKWTSSSAGPCRRSLPLAWHRTWSGGARTSPGGYGRPASMKARIDGKVVPAEREPSQAICFMKSGMVLGRSVSHSAPSSG